MQRMATELGLARDDLRATRDAIRERARIMLYHAAERGIAAYVDMWRFLWREQIRAPLLNVRHWVRAGAFSSFLEKRFR
jgi:hypothetical protein